MWPIEFCCPVGLCLSRAAALVISLGLAGPATAAQEIGGARVHEGPEYTRTVFDTSQEARFEVFTLENPPRIVVDLEGATLAPGVDLDDVALAGTPVRAIRGARRGNGYRIVLDVAEAFLPKGFTLIPVAQYGHRLVVDLYPKRRTRAEPTPVARLPSGEREVVVVIDAGHGGEDPGAIGVGRLQEKHVVLAISKELARLLNGRTGYRAELTRSGDYYISLRERQQIAREKRADLFVSVHADAFRSSQAKGASVYTLSERGASSETARWLAEKENRSDLIGGVGDVSLDDKDDLLAHVLLDLSMDANRVAGIDAGEAVLTSLGRVTPLHKRTVEQAGFVVLKSPDVPSILVESGYLSNPSEARELAKPAHQQKVARAIADGLTAYLARHAPPGTTLSADRGAAIGRGQYVIEAGDTLSGIAARYGVSARRLREANGLAGDVIHVGQVLVIPPS